MAVKIVLVIAALFALGNANIDTDKEECIKALKLDSAVIKKLDALDLPPDNIADFNKFVECDSKKKGLMTENGEVLFDAIEKLVVYSNDVEKLNRIQFIAFKSIISSVIDKCRDKVTDLDPGKNMIRVHACVFKELNLIKIVSGEPLDKDKEECIKELKLDHEEIAKLDALELPPDDNENFNKFVICDSKKKALMSDNGEILFDGILKLLTSVLSLKDCLRFN
ncbi:hypothetical protein FQR65_LT07888 [Abscondita terminalis]|nr:hypothetical protein FQR65_LT07888 [Abscondita terminalis]